jgi:hypothetical protein
MKNGLPSLVGGSVVMMLTNTQDKGGHEKRQCLRFVGNVCLIRAGFTRFISPKFRKLEANPRQYYINIGRASFMTLSFEYENRKQGSKGSVYRLVAHNLHSLVAVLSSLENHKKFVGKIATNTVENVTYL